MTPLIAASVCGHFGVIRYLLKKKVRIDKPAFNGETALYSAASNGYADVACLLLEKGASIDIRTAMGATPLWIASFYGYPNTVECLINNGADVNLPFMNETIVNFHGATPLYAACYSGHIKIVELLLKMKADQKIGIIKYGITPIKIAMKKDYKEVVKRLQGIPLSREEIEAYKHQMRLKYEQQKKESKPMLKTFLK